MKYLAVLLLLALVGEIASAPQKFRYKVNKNKVQPQESVEESSDENDDEPQGDAASEENEESFPRGRPPPQQFGYSGGNSGQNQWNQPSNQPKQNWNQPQQQNQQWNSPQEQNWNQDQPQQQSAPDWNQRWNNLVKNVVRPSRFFRSSFRDDDDSDEEEDDDEDFNDNVVESDIEYRPTGGRSTGGSSFRAGEYYQSNFGRPVSHRPNQRPYYNNREQVYAIRIPASNIRYVQRPYYNENQQYYVPNRRNQYVQQQQYGSYRPLKNMAPVRHSSVAYRPQNRPAYGGQRQREQYSVRRTYVPMRSQGQKNQYYQGSSRYGNHGMRQMRNQRFWKK